MAGDLTDLRQLMRDKHDTDAEILQSADLTKQPIRLPGLTRRWVHQDQDLRIAHQTAQDLHHLLIRHFQRPGHRLQIELTVQLPQRLL